MSKIIIKPPAERKLSKIIAKIAQEEKIEKSGFINSNNEKKTYFKIKSFRLRQLDHENLINIVKEMNKTSDRKVYSDSEVIRGIINYISDNLNVNMKRISPYIKDSS